MLPESILDRFKDVGSEFGLKPVVILILHVNYEFEVASFGTAGYGPDRADINFSLNLVSLQVVNTLISQQQDTRLLEEPSVVLQDFAREYDFLASV